MEKEKNITEDTDRRWSAKDWVAIGISLLALVVSAATGYLANLRQVDDIRVIASIPPEFYLRGENTLVSNGRQSLTFINAGTRNAVITDIFLQITNLGGENEVKKDECSEKGRLIDFEAFDFEGLVLKPGDISTIQLQTANRKWVKAADEFIEDLGPNPIFKRGDTISTCLKIALTTPDAYIPEITIPKYRETLVESSDWYEEPKELSPKNKPVEVYSKAGVSLGFSKQ